MARYGGHKLQFNDRDPAFKKKGKKKETEQAKWGGEKVSVAVNNGTAECTTKGDGSEPVTLACESDYVKKLQEDLRHLGFHWITEADGSFGLATEFAVREFQIYAGMKKVARAKKGADGKAPKGAHEVDHELAESKTPVVSVYVDSLEQVDNDKQYEGPISGVVNTETAAAIDHWRENHWRCPVVIEAWTPDKSEDKGYLPKTLYAGGGNLWSHLAVENNAPYMYARDFSEFYEMPAAHASVAKGGGYIQLGRFDLRTFTDKKTGKKKNSKYRGAFATPKKWTWPEAELLPERLIPGAPTVTQLGAKSDRAQLSTFKVVRAVAEQECFAHFDCLNCYDNLYVSLGPCHWGLRGDADGELGGLLAFLELPEEALAEDPPLGPHRSPAFEDTFGRFGIRPSESWLSKTGQPNGQRLRKKSKKYEGWVAIGTETGFEPPKRKKKKKNVRSREDIAEYLKSWHWFYRWSMTGRSTNPGCEAYRHRMWSMARIRIRDILDAEWGKKPKVAAIPLNPSNSGPGLPTRKATLGDVFTSERSVAMIVRWHVKWPGDVVTKGRAGKGLRWALTEARKKTLDPSWDTDPTNWTDEHEAELIEQLKAAAEKYRPKDMGELFDPKDRNGNPKETMWTHWPKQVSSRGWKLDMSVLDRGEEDESKHEATLREGRASFEFDSSGLPPAPTW